MALRLFLWDAKTNKPMDGDGAISYKVVDKNSGEIEVDPSAVTLAVQLNHLLIINPMINPKSAESAKE